MSGEYIPPRTAARQARAQARINRQNAKEARKNERLLLEPSVGHSEVPAASFLPPLIGELIRLRSEFASIVELATHRAISDYKTVAFGSLRCALQYGQRIENGYRYKKTVKAFWLPGTSYHVVPGYTEVYGGGGSIKGGGAPARRHPQPPEPRESDTFVTLDGRVGIGRPVLPDDPVEVFHSTRNCLVAVNYKLVSPNQHPNPQRLAWHIMNTLSPHLPPPPHTVTPLPESTPIVEPWAVPPSPQPPQQTPPTYF